MATAGKQQHRQQHPQRGTHSRHEERARGSQAGAHQQHAGSQETGLAQRSQVMTPAFMSPFSFMRRFSEGMEQLFNDFGSTGMMPRGMGEFFEWMPQLEMFQREGEFCIRADLPGMNKDDVRVEVRDDAIVLQGERQQEHREEREGHYSNEVSYGRFYREIPLPDGVDADEANATFRDGVLEITMPIERGETRGRQLEIQSGEQQQGRQQQARAAGAGR